LVHLGRIEDQDYLWLKGDDGSQIVFRTGSGIQGGGYPEPAQVARDDRAKSVIAVFGAADADDHRAGGQQSLKFRDHRAIGRVAVRPVRGTCKSRLLWRTGLDQTADGSVV
jgi:hypothetical protein